MKLKRFLLRYYPPGRSGKRGRLIEEAEERSERGRMGMQSQKRMRGKGAWLQAAQFSRSVASDQLKEVMLCLSLSLFLSAGIILEYEQGGETHSKCIDLLDLRPESAYTPLSLCSLFWRNACYKQSREPDRASHNTQP